MEATVSAKLNVGEVIMEIVCEIFIKENKTWGRMALKRTKTSAGGVITEDEFGSKYPDVDEMMKIARVMQGKMGPNMRLIQNW